MIVSKAVLPTFGGVKLRRSNVRAKNSPLGTFLTLEFQI